MRNPRNDGVATRSPAKAGAQGAAQTAPSGDPGPRPAPGNSEPERTCILTRRKGTKDELIRLALGPDGEVAPDVRARAPGRGAWIGVTRGERVERALRQAALDRLGMEARAGNLINGSDRVETAARSGKVHLLIHAADAGDSGRKALDQGWRVGGGDAEGVIFPEGRTILSLALGRENVVHAALTDPAAASRVSRALARWRAFTGPDRGLEGGEPASGPVSAEDNLTKE